MMSSFLSLPSSRRRTTVVVCALVAMFCVDAVAARGVPAGRRFVGAPRAANAGAARVQQQQRAMQRPAPVPPRPVEAQPAPVRNEPSVEAPPQEGGKPGRLTPDERRALRQQINDAGRDLYRPSRP